jgi:LacI family transcriptional regulator
MPATIRDVAREAGTSVAAVSAALSAAPRHNIRVSEATKARIREAATRLGFTPNPLAQSLVTRKTGTLGLVFPYSGAFVDRNPFCSQVMSGVFEEVVREKYNLMLHTAIGDDWNAAETSALIDPRVDGLLLVVPAPDSPVVAHCIAQGFPCVTVVYDGRSASVPSVNADERAGGRLAAEHLIRLRHRRIAHLAGGPEIASSRPRQDGFLAVLEEAAVEARPELMVEGGYTVPSGRAALARLLDLPRERRPTALFAANDLCADGALAAMAERGLRAPNDIAVVGFDDTWYAAMTRPPLTSVHMPIAEMAAEATRMLIAIVEKRPLENSSVVLPVSLSIRESCGAASAETDLNAIP